MTEEMGSLRYLDGSHVEGPLGFQSDSVGDPDIREQFPDLKQREVVAGGPIKAGDARATLGPDSPRFRSQRGNARP